MSDSRGWFVPVVAVVVAVAAALALIAGAGDLALVAAALGAGAIGLHSALVTPEPAVAPPSGKVLVVDVSHRDRERDDARR